MKLINRLLTNDKCNHYIVLSFNWMNNQNKLVESQIRCTCIRREQTKQQRM